MIKVLRRPIESTLGSRVRVVDDAGGGEVHAGAPAGKQGVFQGHEHHPGVHDRGDHPAEDHPRIGVDDEGDVTKALAGPHVGEVRDPPLIRVRRIRPSAVDPVRVPAVSGVGHRRFLTVHPA